MNSELKEACDAVLTALRALGQLQRDHRIVLSLKEEHAESGALPSEAEMAEFFQYRECVVLGTEALFEQTQRASKLLTDDILHCLSSTHREKVQAGGKYGQNYVEVAYELARGWCFLIAAAVVGPIWIGSREDAEKWVPSMIDLETLEDSEDAIFHVLDKIDTVDVAALEADIGCERRLAEQAMNRGPWSKPDSPSRWAKVFGISLTTFKKRIDKGSIRVKDRDGRMWRVHVEDLPAGHEP